MRIKEGFKLRKVCGNAIVVAVGDNTDLNGLVTLNATGEYLWSILSNGAQEEQIAQALVQKYNIDIKTARRDANDFILQLKGAGLLA